MDLNTIWFLLVGILIAGYAVLDGFDLGIGSLYYMLGKSETDKRILLASIGPFWNGNEVWLLTGGGALFAAFPLVYASVFSGFYLAMMLVLFGLIMRAAALEFRDRIDDEQWHKRFDLMFFVGSFLPALLLGVAMGNIAGGIPLDNSYRYTGGFFDLLNPYALLLGVLGLFAFLAQGSAYAVLKNEDTLQERAAKLMSPICWVWLLLFLLASVVTYLFEPGLCSNYLKYPVLYLLPLLAWISIAAAPLLLRNGHKKASFLASSLGMLSMIGTLGAGMYPNLARADNPANTLTIYNASSSPLTLKVMLIIALIGVPIVLIYTIWMYWVLRGPVKLDEAGY